MCSARFRALRDVSVKEMEVNGLAVILQHNPDRIGSTTAKVDAASINSRPCFLCPDNEPAEQRRLSFDGRKGRKYNIQINPFPIFPQHLVIASARHQEQSIWHHLVDMLDIVRHTPEFTVFYNGPESGASAPDHLHYQACPRSQMPLERAVDAVLDKVRILEEDDRRSGVDGELDYLVHLADAKLYHYTRFCRGVFAVRGRTSKSVAKLFYRLLESAPTLPGDKEPRINLFLWYTGSEYRIWATADELPYNLTRAFVAVEDARFYTHNGIDMKGILRAGYAIFRSGDDTAQGGSTLTQQVVKQLLLNPSQNIQRKIREWYLALEVEEVLKEQYGHDGAKNLILELYLNYNFLGNNCYGIEKAANFYFDKEAKDMTVPKAGQE